MCCLNPREMQETQCEHLFELREIEGAQVGARTRHVSHSRCHGQRHAVLQKPLAHTLEGLLKLGLQMANLPKKYNHGSGTTSSPNLVTSKWKSLFWECRSFVLHLGVL